MPVAIKSRLAWEVLFVQPIAQQMDMGQVKGTLHLCQLISQHYDTVVKTGFCNFPPTGPTPPAPMVSGKTPLFQTSAFVGLKASEVLNMVKNPPLMAAAAALTKAMKKNQDKIDKLKKKKEELEPLIKKSKELIEKGKGIKDVYDKAKALDYRGAIDAGAKQFSSPLIPGFDKLKERSDQMTEPEIKKEINKKIEKEKQKVIKKLEPIKLKIEKKKKEIEDKIKDLISRVTQKITKKIAEAQIKKAKLAADTAKAASMSYIQTVEANIALAKAKIAAAKALIKKVKLLVKNVMAIAAWVKTLKAAIKKFQEFAKSLPELKDLLKPPKPPSLPGGNLLGFGKFEPKMPAMNLDIRSENFKLPDVPEPPDIKSEVEELKSKGIEAVKNNPTLKRKVAKLEQKVEKQKIKIEQKMEKIKLKVDELKKKVEDKINEVKKKATDAAKKLLLKLIPPGKKDPTAKVKILKEKKEKLDKLIKRAKELKEKIEVEVVQRIKQIKELIARGQAIIAIAKLVKEGGLENYKKAIDEGAKPFKSPTIPGFDTLKEKKDMLTEPELKKELMKKIDKITEKNRKKLEKMEMKLEKKKKEIEEKMEPINEKIDKVKAFADKFSKPPKAPEVTISGKLIAAALSVGLIGYWAGGTVSLPGGIVIFPGLPLQALKTLDGKNAEAEIAKIFNKDSEMDNADKMRTLANVFEAHFKTIAGMWQMPTPGGPVPTPWISYG